MEEAMNETCSHCGSFAGFETSPEGECCGICDNWVCNDCVDFRVSKREYKLPNGEIVAQDIICKKCSNELGLPNLTPIRDL